MYLVGCQGVFVSLSSKSVNLSLQVVVGHHLLCRGVCGCHGDGVHRGGHEALQPCESLPLLPHAPALRRLHHHHVLHDHTLLQQGTGGGRGCRDGVLCHHSSLPSDRLHSHKCPPRSTSVQYTSRRAGVPLSPLTRRPRNGC